ncbi:hypothetical protein GCK72_002089 [Caenorhabditis remanei]|uniref:Uncharacterized protein n=1 Tax=Caenorhabditis remanei TaxID=31234 RepID=A0A6A5HSS6_CAERE|nr:hypothetical protein GCK72_002089 [Caenorhabditis remanei]KAF1770271.1 hypothetical protein GCK72_002089 [Caenorhabditis remanei]
MATSSHSDDYEPREKRSRMAKPCRKQPTHQMRLPIILPRLPPKVSTSQNTSVRLISTPPTIVPSSSNPRPLISLLDRTEFRDRSRVAMITQQPSKPKKCYYTELNEIRREFGIPETFDTNKPNTMSGVALAEKLQLLQRMRGENKFLLESIQKKQNAYEERRVSIEQVRRVTQDTIDNCHLLKETLQTVEEDNLRLRSQLR